jgi:hypothetical protein
MMLKITRRARLAVILATTTVAMIAGLALAGSAFANHAWHSDQPPTLNGGWAPMNRCPVDDPAMLAADGKSSQAMCVGADSPSGSITIGNLTVATQAIDHQFGVVLNQEGGPNTVVVPAGGVFADEPAQLPGGIQELICPSSGHVGWHICRNHHRGWGWGGRADAATLTMESTGEPTNFNLFAGLFPGVPIVTMPVKIHLQNQLLGDDCYIGSDTEPILLQPMNLDAPSAEFISLATDGTLVPEGQDPEPDYLTNIVVHSTQGANSFAVPAASGCGFRGYFNQAINSKLGLPSSASTNNVTFNEATSSAVHIGFYENSFPNDGKELAKDWHSAVLPPERGDHDHGHGHHGGYRHWSGGELEAYLRHRFRRGH